MSLYEDIISAICRDIDKEAYFQYVFPCNRYIALSDKFTATHYEKNSLEFYEFMRSCWYNQFNKYYGIFENKKLKNFETISEKFNNFSFRLHLDHNALFSELTEIINGRKENTLYKGYGNDYLQYMQLYTKPSNSHFTSCKDCYRNYDNELPACQVCLFLNGDKVRENRSHIEDEENLLYFMYSSKENFDIIKEYVRENYERLFKSLIDFSMGINIEPPLRAVICPVLKLLAQILIYNSDEIFSFNDKEEFASYYCDKLLDLIMENYWKESNLTHKTVCKVLCMSLTGTVYDDLLFNDYSVSLETVNSAISNCCGDIINFKSPAAIDTENDDDATIKSESTPGEPIANESVIDESAFDEPVIDESASLEDESDNQEYTEENYGNEYSENFDGFDSSDSFPSIEEVVSTQDVIEEPDYKETVPSVSLTVKSSAQTSSNVSTTSNVEKTVTEDTKNEEANTHYNDIEETQSEKSEAVLNNDTSSEDLNEETEDNTISNENEQDTETDEKTNDVRNILLNNIEPTSKNDSNTSSEIPPAFLFDEPLTTKPLEETELKDEDNGTDNEITSVEKVVSTVTAIPEQKQEISVVENNSSSAKLIDTPQDNVVDEVHNKFSSVVLQKAEDDFIIDNHFYEHEKYAEYLGESASFASFENVVLYDRYMAIEALVDNKGRDFLLFWGRSRKTFYYIYMTDTEILEIIKPYLTRNSYLKICYQPYHLYSLGRKYGIEIKRVFSIQTCYSFFNSHKPLLDYEKTLESLLEERLSFRITEKKYPMLLAGMKTYPLLCSKFNKIIQNTKTSSEMDEHINFDEAMGTSYYIGDLYEDAGASSAFKLVGPNSYSFPLTDRGKTKMPGMYFTFVILSGYTKEEARNVFYRMITDLAEKGRFRKSKIYLCFIDDMTIRFFVPKYYVSFFETSLISYLTTAAKTIVGKKLHYKLDEVPAECDNPEEVFIPPVVENKEQTSELILDELNPNLKFLFD